MIYCLYDRELEEALGSVEIYFALHKDSDSNAFIMSIRVSIIILLEHTVKLKTLHLPFWVFKIY